MTLAFAAGVIIIADETLSSADISFWPITTIAYISLVDQVAFYYTDVNADSIRLKYGQVRPSRRERPMR